MTNRSRPHEIDKIRKLLEISKDNGPSEKIWFHKMYDAINSLIDIVEENSQELMELECAITPNPEKTIVPEISLTETLSSLVATHKLTVKEEHLGYFISTIRNGLYREGLECPLELSDELLDWCSEKEDYMLTKKVDYVDLSSVTGGLTKNQLLKGWKDVISDLVKELEKGDK